MVVECIFKDSHGEILKRRKRRREKQNKDGNNDNEKEESGQCEEERRIGMEDTVMNMDKKKRQKL